MNFQNNDRLACVDWAKSIGIFLIIWGHFCATGGVPRIIMYSFHVPLFACVSGLLLDPRKNTLTKIPALFKRILLPYAFWFLLSSIVDLLLSRLTIANFISNFLFLNGTMNWNSALWYAICFFYTSILVYVFFHITKAKEWIIGIAVLSSFLAVIVLNRLNIVIGWFGLDKVLLLFGFVCLGWLFKKHLHKLLSAKKVFPLILSTIIFVACAIVVSVCNFKNNISILNLDYNNIFLFVLTSILMTLSFLCCCIIFPKNNIVKMISDNTLLIMCSHLFFRLILSKFITIKSDLIAFAISCAILFFYIAFLMLVKHIFSQKPKLSKALLWIGIKL